MSQDYRARLKQQLESGEARLEPLTFPQRELWEASPVAPGDVSNHICAFIEVRGNIAPEDSVAAIRRVLNRQEVLRLSFLPGKSQPLQFIRTTGEPQVKLRDLTPAESGPEALEEIMQEIFRQPFDLLRGPLYRVEMLRRGPEDLVIVLSMHHAIGDGWSLGVFVEDLCNAYLQGKGALPAVPITYAAWGATERAAWTPERLAQRLAYWQPHLADRSRLWESPAGGRRLERWVSDVPADAVPAVRDLARRTGATLFSTLLASFQTTLAQWTGVLDVLVGSPAANRSKTTVRETMGYFADNIPMRSRIDPARPLEETIRVVHENAVEAFANAMPFAELAKALDPSPAPGANRIYDVRFALQNHPIPDVNLPGLSLKLTMRSTGTARFDLGCEVTEHGAALEVVWLFRPELFSLVDVQELHRIFLTVLTGSRARS